MCKHLSFWANGWPAILEEEILSSKPFLFHICEVKFKIIQSILTYLQKPPILFFYLQWNLPQIFHHHLWMASDVSKLFLVEEAPLSATEALNLITYYITAQNNIKISDIIMMENSMLSMSTNDCLSSSLFLSVNYLWLTATKGATPDNNSMTGCD